MRADFYHRCAAYADLAARVSGNQLLVGAMDDEGLRQAIEEPARLAGLEFEQGLVDTIIDDVRGEPGALPLLEHSLLELWQRRRARMMTLEGYRESGGVQGAIARRADSIFDEFDGGQQATSRRVLMRLTQIGEGTEDTRRRAAMSELATNRLDAPNVDDVVRRWTDARLLTVTADDAGERWVTVAHEALIRVWPRLKRWLDEDRAGQRLHRQITEAASEWRRLGSDESLLWRGLRLGQASEFKTQNDAALNDLEREFIDAGTRVQRLETEQRDRSRKRTLVALSAGIAAALLLASLAGWQWWRAEEEQTNATARALVSQSDLLRTQASATATGWAARLEDGALLAIEAHRLRPTSESATVLREAADALGRSTRVIPLTRAEDHVPAIYFDTLAVASPTPETVSLIDLGTGETKHRFSAAAAVRLLMFSPTAVYLAAITESTVEMWTAGGTGAPRKLWERPAGPYGGIFPGTFSPDGMLWAGIAGASVELVNASTGEPVRRIDLKGPVSQVVFSRDGSHVAFAAGTTARIWAIPTGQFFEIEQQGISGIAIDGRGQHVAVASAGTVDVWDVLSQRRTVQIRALAGGEDAEYINHVALDDQGSRVGVVGEYGTALHFSAIDGRQLWSRNLPEGAYLPTLPPYAAFKSSSGIEIWDTAYGEALARILSPDVEEAQVAFWVPAPRRAVVFGKEGAWVYSMARGSEERQRPVIGGAVDLTRDGSLVLTHNERGDSGRVARVTDDVQVWRQPDLDRVAISRDGRYVAATKADDTLRVWEVTTGKELWNTTVPAKTTYTDEDDDEVVTDNVQAVVFSDAGDTVGVRLYGGNARAWGVRDGVERKGDAVASALNDRVHVSPDGRYRATVSENTVVVADGSGNTLATVRHDADPDPDLNAVRDLVFSADSRFLATAGADRTARIWTTEGIEVARVPHFLAVAHVAFGDNGRLLTTLSDDAVVRDFIWRDDDLFAHICGRLTRNLSASQWRTFFGSRDYEATCPKLPIPPPPED
jgi:WD40 repeat protein